MSPNRIPMWIADKGTHSPGITDTSTTAPTAVPLRDMHILSAFATETDRTPDGLGRRSSQVKVVG